ncbi:hypothetical protein ACET3Z_032737 [Daucus carota]
MKIQLNSALFIATVFILAIEMSGTDAACNALALSSCLPAVQNPSQAPSATCCNNLRSQQSCLCGYLKNPFLRGYVNSPGSKRVASAYENSAEFRAFYRNGFYSGYRNEWNGSSNMQSRGTVFMSIRDSEPEPSSISDLLQ